MSVDAFFGLHVRNVPFSNWQISDDSKLKYIDAIIESQETDVESDKTGTDLGIVKGKWGLFTDKIP